MKCKLFGIIQRKVFGDRSVNANDLNPGVKSMEVKTTTTTITTITITTTAIRNYIRVICIYLQQLLVI